MYRVSKIGRNAKALGIITRTAGWTVLMLVDGETERRSARTILEQFGNRVIEADDEDDAIALFERHPEIDLVLDDVMATGGRVVSACRERRDVSAILVTDRSIGRKPSRNPVLPRAFDERVVAEALSHAARQVGR